MPDNTTIHMVPESRKSGLTKRTLTYCKTKTRNQQRYRVLRNSSLIYL